MYILVEDWTEADAVVPLADDVVTERRRVPAVACLFDQVRLLAERLLPQDCP